MIDIVKQTPWEYSSQSRDYQVIARLYTALFNFVKTYIDNLSIWDTNIDNRLTMLRAKTLNFEPDHSWDLDDLEAVTTCFKYLMRNKGTVKALEYCVDILMRIENIVGESIDNVVTMTDYNVTIRVPEDLFTLGIIEDLVKYLLPSGLTYNIIKYKSYNLNDIIYTDIYYDELASNSGQWFIKYRHVADNARMYVGTDKSTTYITDGSGNILQKQLPNYFQETYIYSDNIDDNLNDHVNKEDLAIPYE
mgnify:CR=1 FL=1